MPKGQEKHFLEHNASSFRFVQFFEAVLKTSPEKIEKELEFFPK
jgi:hypothetical protein